MFEGKKTYIAAGGLVLYAALGYAMTAFFPDVAAQAGIHVDLQATIQLVLNALGLGGLRAAVAKV
jgi:hypothetical protein